MEVIVRLKQIRIQSLCVIMCFVSEQISVVLSCLCLLFFFFFLKEGAELAEGDGQEVDQQAHEEVPDDQQEEQDEY